MRAKLLDIGQDYLFLHAYGLGHSQGPYMAKSFVANAKLIHKTLGFFVFIIFEDLSFFFSNLMVCQRSRKMLCPLKNNFLLKLALKGLSKLRSSVCFILEGSL